MSEVNKKEAAEHAGRAARQAKHAAKNLGEAAEQGAEHVKDEVVEGAEKAVRAANDVIPRIRPGIVAALARESGVGFLAMSVAVYAGTLSVRHFQAAYALGKGVVAK